MADQITLRPGDRVEDRECDKGTVLRIEGDDVFVDGDAGTQPWHYRPHQLTRITQPNVVTPARQIVSEERGA